jgi:hypothetical protein
MSKQDNLHDFLVDIADAIREKKGSSEKINPQNFSEEIRSIESGTGTTEYAFGETMVDNTGNGVNDISVIRFSDDLKIIPPNAYNGFKGKASIIFPEGLTTIESSAFMGSSIVKADLPNSVSSIQSNAFRATANLLTHRFPKLLTAIQQYTYYQGGLTSFVAEGKIASVGNSSFMNSKLVTFVLRGVDAVATLASNAFNGTPISSKNGSIYVPDNLVDSYKSATNWSVYADQIKPLSEYQPTTE